MTGAEEEHVLEEERVQVDDLKRGDIADAGVDGYGSRHQGTTRTFFLWFLFGVNCFFVWCELIFVWCELLFEMRELVNVKISRSVF